MGNAVDLWLTAGNSARDGMTNVINNGFYDDGDDRPKVDHRLDFILMQAGRKFIPIISDMQVLRYKRGGHYISDHFGLYLRFDKCV